MTGDLYLVSQTVLRGCVVTWISWASPLRFSTLSLAGGTKNHITTTMIDQTCDGIPDLHRHTLSLRTAYHAVWDYGTP